MTAGFGRACLWWEAGRPGGLKGALEVVLLTCGDDPGAGP